jgi:hypothetical protein
VDSLLLLLGQEDYLLLLDILLAINFILSAQKKEEWIGMDLAVDSSVNSRLSLSYSLVLEWYSLSFLLSSLCA